MLKKNLFSIVVLLSLTGLVLAQDSTQFALWQDFQAKYGEDLKVKWNQLANTPSLIYGHLIDLGYSGTKDNESIKKLALNFITENKELFRTAPEKLVCWKNHQQGKHWVISFYQQYEGLKVYNSKFGIVFNEDLKIKLIGDHYHPDIKISTTPTLSSDEAINIAAQSENITQISDVKQTTRIIYPIVTHHSISYRLAWKFELVSKDPFVDKIFFVDAQMGEILASDNAFRTGGIISGTVTGKVRTDGGSTVLKNFYDEYVDIVEETKRTTTASNGTYSINVSSSSSVTLKFLLQGPWAQVNTADPAQCPFYKSYAVTAPATKNHSWQTVTQGGLGVASVFYYMNEIHKFFNSLDYYGWDAAMTAFVDISCPEGRALENSLEFRDPYTESSDNIYHEYTHNVVYDIFDGWIGESESSSSHGNAMDEAFSDYFACTKNGNPVWRNGIDTWTAERNIDTPDKVYPGDMGSNAHENGRIVSGACWDLRTRIGATVSNQLLFDALAMMATIYNRPYYFGLYLDCVYNSNNNWKNEDDIEYAFTTVHGIERMAAKRILLPDEEQQEQTQSGLPKTFSLNQNHPNPFNSTTRIDYQIADLKTSHSYPLTLKIYNINGQLVKTLVDEKKKPGAYSVIWYGKDENDSQVVSGVYIIKMKTDQFVNHRKMILLR